MNAAVPAKNLSEFEASRNHVLRIVRRAGTSFYWAMRFLPKAKREAIFAVYAFCREVDDIADEAGTLEEKRSGLEAWRRQIEKLYAGQANWPTSLALAHYLKIFPFEKQAFLAIIDGMEMDAEGPIRAPAMAELEEYCARVAGAVGLLCIQIFGESGDRGREIATSLGLALQLTNILRDLQDDAGMGRLYLPAELLEKHGIVTTEPAEVLIHPALPLVCRELAGRAAAEFDKADRAMAECDREAMRPARIMQKVYQRILKRLRRNDWRDLLAGRRPGRITKFAYRVEKLSIALWQAIF